MLKRLMVGGLAIGALSYGTPAAWAAEPVYDCGFDSVQQDDATGQNYEGIIYGVIADSDGDPVSLRCYLTVNGAEVGAQASGSGTGVAVAVGTISFAATADDDVDICADVNGAFAECFQSDSHQIPPQEVIDAIDGVFELADAVIFETLTKVFQAIGFVFTDILDPLDCPVLAALSPGMPGIVDITEEGDVYVFGDHNYDCPPYEIH